MNKSPAKRAKFLTRREFFPAAARYGALAVLAAIAAAAGARRSRPAAQKCVNKSICRGCGAFDGCGLPAALSAKGASSRG